MFYKFINLLKMSILYKKSGFIILKNKSNERILKKFLSLKIIKFTVLKKNKIFVYINYIDNKPIFKNITNMYKKSNRKYISILNLKKVSLNNNWILILSTNKGLLNSFEALKSNVGGVIIAKIWN